jgi:hypothetical protein
MTSRVCRALPPVRGSYTENAPLSPPISHRGT